MFKLPALSDQQSKDVQFTVTENKEMQQILLNEKLEPERV